jgi:hypothetical protein
MFRLAKMSWQSVAGRIVQEMLREYIDYFSKWYSPNTKVVGSRYDTKIVTMLIKTLEGDRHKAWLRKIKGFIVDRNSYV